MIKKGGVVGVFILGIILIGLVGMVSGAASTPESFSLNPTPEEIYEWIEYKGYSSKAILTCVDKFTALSSNKIYECTRDKKQVTCDSSNLEKVIIDNFYPNYVQTKYICVKKKEGVPTHEVIFVKGDVGGNYNEEHTPEKGSKVWFSRFDSSCWEKALFPAPNCLVYSKEEDLFGKDDCADGSVVTNFIFRGGYYPQYSADWEKNQLQKFEIAKTSKGEIITAGTPDGRYLITDWEWGITNSGESYLCRDDGYWYECNEGVIGKKLSSGGKTWKCVLDWNKEYKTKIDSNIIYWWKDVTGTGETPKPVTPTTTAQCGYANNLRDISSKVVLFNEGLCVDRNIASLVTGGIGEPYRWTCQGTDGTIPCEAYAPGQTPTYTCINPNLCISGTTCTSPLVPKTEFSCRTREICCEGLEDTKNCGTIHTTQTSEVLTTLTPELCKVTYSPTTPVYESSTKKYTWKCKTSSCWADYTGTITPITCDKDGIKETGEQCDGTDLNGKTCASVLGSDYTRTLSCKSDCTFDTSRCTKGGGGGEKGVCNANINGKEFEKFSDLDGIFSSEGGCSSGTLTQDLTPTNNELTAYSWKCGTVPLCTATIKEDIKLSPSYAIDGNCDNTDFVEIKYTNDQGQEVTRKVYCPAPLPFFTLTNIVAVLVVVGVFYVIMQQRSRRRKGKRKR